jgi:hypothetical protein
MELAGVAAAAPQRRGPMDCRFQDGGQLALACFLLREAMLLEVAAAVPFGASVVKVETEQRRLLDLPPRLAMAVEGVGAVLVLPAVMVAQHLCRSGIDGTIIMTSPSGSTSRCVAGALTDTSFVVNADVLQSAAFLRIVVSVNPDLSSPFYTSSYVMPVVTTGNQLTYKTVSFAVSGLNPNTTYYYRIESQGAPNQLDTIKSLKTAPPRGVPAAFTHTTGGCTNINFSGLAIQASTIHRAMSLENSLFFLHTDDIIYSDISTTDVGLQRDANVRMYGSSPDVQALLNVSPMAYIPGDHDMGPNDSTLDNTNGEQIFRNSRQVYRETFPGYPYVQIGLGETNIDHVLLTQVFDIANVRFIMPDCMSQSRLGGSALGRALGSGDYWDQRSWLATAFAKAVTDGISYIFLCLPRAWNGYNQICFNDSFTADRTFICDTIEACSVPCALIVGDTHCAAFDDGGNCAAFCTDGFGKFPQIQASGMFNIPVADVGVFSWNGANTFVGKGGTTGVADGQYVLITMSADNKNWTAVIKGAPINQSTFVPTTLKTVSTTDVTPAVSFNNAAPSVAHGTPLTVNLDKTWFGSCSVHWASSDGQNGNVTFLPNKKRASFSITFVSAGSPTITLSSPSGCTISGTNPATVTVT